MDEFNGDMRGWDVITGEGWTEGRYEHQPPIPNIVQPQAMIKKPAPTAQQIHNILSAIGRVNDGPLPFFAITKPNEPTHMRIQWSPKANKVYGYYGSLMIYRCKHACYEQRGSGRCCRCDDFFKRRLLKPTSFCLICKNHTPTQPRLLS
jgi:hypothetical protein